MDDGAPRRGRSRGRGGRARGRARGRGRGRGKKAIKIIESDEELDVQSQTGVEESQNDEPAENSVSQIDLETDISQLEAPTFTTLNRGPPEPMLRLDWSHKVNLIGEKVLNPMIHCCGKCQKPILIYGRMIPCKHVFCLACSKQEQKQCPRCLDKVTRVEQTGLGTVFMCTYGGTRYGTTGCRRTYLSQRDLQAHINHRHVSAQQSIEVTESDRTSLRNKSTIDPRNTMSLGPTNVRQQQQRSNQSAQGVTGVRTNLITIPIQDSTPSIHEAVAPAQSYYNQYQPAPTYTQTQLPPLHMPPPQQPQYYAPPPAYSPAQPYAAYNSNAPPAPTPFSAPPTTTHQRAANQYDYSTAPPPPPPQWTNNAQYYR